MGLVFHKLHTTENTLSVPSNLLYGAAISSTVQQSVRLSIGKLSVRSTATAWVAAVALLGIVLTAPTKSSI